MPWMALLAAAFADCGPGGLTTLPASGGTLAGELVLTGSGVDRGRLRPATEVALRSGDEEIALRVVDTLVGTLDTTQWVLAPVAPPAPDRPWVLVIDGQIEEGFERGAKRPLSWTVGPSGPALAWTGVPEVRSTARHRMGCGPSVQVLVAVPVMGAAAIEVAVRPVAGGPVGRARLPIHDGTVSIGRGMCGGPFELEAGVEYFAALVAIDPQGRRAPADDSPLRFTAP